ncbi:MAG: ABC transporter ATP-binding protein [Candidatus Sumerlaeales bacterium]|nr:ABC transporter ATP-binding protein [Candidatus Sumerlaeales bacterium]
MIRAEELLFHYVPNRLVIDSVCHTFDDGMIHVIVGSNGSGKSTLLKLLTGILTPTSGTIRIDNSIMTKVYSKHLARMISYVPQKVNQLFPYTVMDMVMMGRSPYLKPLSLFFNEHDHECASHALTQLGIEHLKDEVYSNISGGEQQLTLIARAIAQDTKHIVLDEPTAFVDLKYQQVIMKVLQKYKLKKKCIIIVMHDIGLALDWADQMVFLKQGRILAAGKSSDVVNNDALSACFDTKLKLVKLSNNDKIRVVFDD